METTSEAYRRLNNRVHELENQLTVSQAECERLKGPAMLGEMIMELTSDLVANDATDKTADGFINVWLAQREKLARAESERDTALRELAELRERVEAYFNSPRNGASGKLRKWHVTSTLADKWCDCCGNHEAKGCDKNCELAALLTEPAAQKGGE